MVLQLMLLILTEFALLTFVIVMAIRLTRKVFSMCFDVR